MHNYSTPYAIRILKNLVPALKPGARVLINDHCLREPGREDPWDERVMRRMDVVMLTLLNAQERTEEEFRALFAAAGDGFVFKVRTLFFGTGRCTVWDVRGGACADGHWIGRDEAQGLPHERHRGGLEAG